MVCSVCGSPDLAPDPLIPVFYFRSPIHDPERWDRIVDLSSHSVILEKIQGQIIQYNMIRRI